MSLYKYDTERRDYPLTTPLTMIRPADIHVLSCSSGVMAHYQKLMSKAKWRPAPGRKLGFLVVQDDSLLGLVFLASPVIRLEVRDKYLFPNADAKFRYGTATRDYMDMSVCVASQPIAWHWNLGKLMALIAPTLSDHVNARYPKDTFRGVTTTSLWGKSVQYNRIYKYLGLTKGHGHEHIDDETYADMVAYLREHCVHCNPHKEERHSREWWRGWAIPLKPRRNKRKDEEAKETSPETWCAVPGSRFGDGANARMRIIQACIAACAVPGCNFEEGSNPRMRRIAAFLSATKDKSVGLTHGKLRGVYYHPAVPADQRPAVIQSWFQRWGLPRYERTKNLTPPYQSGLEGREA